MKITAQAKSIRITPQKLRRTADSLRQLPLDQALEQLQFINVKSAQELYRVLSQAVANATTNYNLKPENLKLDSIQINEGPILKRFQAVSRGRAHTILKRTSHVLITLTPKVSTSPSIKPTQSTTTKKTTK